MTEIVSGRIERSVDDEFDDFSEVLDGTDPSLFDFFDARTMTHPDTLPICNRLLMYLDSTDRDSLFATEAGIHFAITIAGLAGHKTNRTLEILSDMLSGYEHMEYCDARNRIEEAVDDYFEDNPNIFGLTEGYLLTDVWEDDDDSYKYMTNDPTRLASRLSAGLTFLALEERAAMMNIDAGIEDLLQDTIRYTG